MKTVRIKTIVILLTSLLYIGSNQIMAQKEGMMHGSKEGCGGMCCNIPDLNDAQKKKIEELKTTHQKAMLQLKSQMDIKRAQLENLRIADKPDMNAINKTVDELGAIHIQMMKERENHIQQVRAQLTDAQRVQFDLHKGKGFCGKHEMGRHEHGGPGMWPNEKK